MIPHDPNRPQIDPRGVVLEGRERELFELIAATGYVPDDQNFSDFCESLKSCRAWLISGTRGSGKTAFPEALASACNLTMCVVAGRDGLKQEEILYDWDHEEQEVWMRENLTIAKALPEEEQSAFLERARKKKWQREFLILGEVGAAYDLAAKAASSKTPPPVLLLDESDKFGASIEDSLLMPLERGLIYIPRYEGGCIGVADWLSRPIVITTSNDLRHKLSTPFISRHIFSRFATPSLTTELEILSARNANASSAQLALSIKLLDAVRGVAGMEDHPSLRESIDVTGAFTRSSIETLDETLLSRFFCYFVKTGEARELLNIQIDYLLAMTNSFNPEVDTWLASRDPEWAKRWPHFITAERQ
ncbi:MAG TPA: AAA family ATPase [Pyrinomonadaceae bacterium]|nr:AAA family ATPase [Pyrinomonadaceae bacterium]HMP67095.1 AAA family ATPase [Pyrinomonadaceae bacterium]